MLKFFKTETGECKTWPNIAWLVLRIALGVVFVLHGYGKLFGEPGITGFAGFLTSLSVPMPLFFAWVVAIVEFFGGLAVLLGAFSRWAAGLIAIDMFVAFWLTKGGLPKGDLDFALFAIAVAIALAGPGTYTVIRGKFRNW